MGEELAQWIRERKLIPAHKLIKNEREIIVGDAFMRRYSVRLLDVGRRGGVYESPSFRDSTKDLSRLLSLLMEGKRPKIRGTVLGKKILHFEIIKEDASDEIDWSRGKVAYVDTNIMGDKAVLVLPNATEIIVSNMSVNGANLPKEKGWAIQFIGHIIKREIPICIMICYKKLERLEEENE